MEYWWNIPLTVNRTFLKYSTMRHLEHLSTPNVSLQGGHGGLCTVLRLHVAASVYRCVHQGVDASQPTGMATAEEEFKRLEELREQFYASLKRSSFMESIGEVE